MPFTLIRHYHQREHDDAIIHSNNIVMSVFANVPTKISSKPKETTSVKDKPNVAAKTTIVRTIVYVTQSKKITHKNRLYTGEIIDAQERLIKAFKRISIQGKADIKFALKHWLFIDHLEYLDKDDNVVEVVFPKEMGTQKDRPPRYNVVEPISEGGRDNYTAYGFGTKWTEQKNFCLWSDVETRELGRKAMV